MKFRQGYINVRKKAEKKEKRDKKQERQKERNKERKRKIVNLAYSAEHRISMFYRGELDS